jgi:hypothetical protein
MLRNTSGLKHGLIFLTVMIAVNETFPMFFEKLLARCFGGNLNTEGRKRFHLRPMLTGCFAHH